MKVRFHPEARKELIESGKFYETVSRGLGADFLDAVEAATACIRQFPDSGGPVREYL